LTFPAIGRTLIVAVCHHPKVNTVNSTYFGLLAEFGEANIPLERVAPKYFGLSYEEARRRAPAKMLPCRRSDWVARSHPGSSVRPISPS